MATCVNDSRNHGYGGFCGVDSYESHANPSLCKFISCLPTQNRHPPISRQLHKQHAKQDQIWLKIREEAILDAKQEPRVLSRFYYDTIVCHDTLESALANHLAVKLCTASISSNSLYEVFVQALQEENEENIDDHEYYYRNNSGIRGAIRADLRAWKERDPACLSYVHCFLNFKGFLACQAHRISHKFWVQGRTAMAVLIQSRVSEVFGVDIHPGARIGRGIVMDHATGVVVGETSVVGDNVTIFHNVTLGGTGKVAVVLGRERHPKIGDGVLIGAGAKVLGNIRVGDGAKIGAASVVLKEVPPGATVVGNPARLVPVKKKNIRPLKT